MENKCRKVRAITADCAFSPGCLHEGQLPFQSSLLLGFITLVVSVLAIDGTEFGLATPEGLSQTMQDCSISILICLSQSGRSGSDSWMKPVKFGEA